MTDRHDDDLPELSEEAARVERLLLDSATLDRPRASVQHKALDAGLRELDGSKLVRQLWLPAAAGLAIAAGAAFWLFGSGAPAPRAAKPEPPVAVEAPVRKSPPPSPAPCRELMIARGDRPLIEDWERHDSSILHEDGRTGTWLTYDDGTGKQTPPARSPLFPSKLPGSRDASRHALHVFGGKFTDWGVTFGAELVDAGCYDASAYAGIEFWARGKGPLKVGLQMIDVHDAKYGGLCQSDCYNTHRKVVELAPTWNRYQVRWEELRQLYEDGPPLAFDPRRVRFIEFGIGPEATPFDIWLDDVAFVRR